MLDYLSIYADELAALCAPGEQALALLTVQYAPGEEHVGPRASSVTFDPLDGLSVSAWDDAAGAAVTGITLRGEPGCMAAHVKSALGGPSSELVATNQRVFLVDELGGKPTRPSWSISIRDVAITPDPRWNQRGRITLRFRDGSLLRLVAGYLSGRKARRFCNAVAGAQGTAR